ncbi:MAG: hypothetical protein QXZ09_10400 [Candidatus Methanomethylicaceae archaeon]
MPRVLFRNIVCSTLICPSTEDPLSFAAGDANLYRYVFNTPTVFTDPSGQAIFIPLVIMFATAVVGTTVIATSTHTVTHGWSWEPVFDFVTLGTYPGWCCLREWYHGYQPTPP